MKKLIFCAKIIIFICIISLIFNIGFAKVEGNSMKPKFENNDLIIYTKFKNNIERFDIVVLKINGEYFFKRVIGLPGEKIEYIDNTLYVNGIEVEEKFQKSITKDFNVSSITSSDVISKNKVLVLGDNRLYSSDSREFGLISINNIKGIFLLKIL